MSTTAVLQNRMCADRSVQLHLVESAGVQCEVATVFMQNKTHIQSSQLSHPMEKSYLCQADVQAQGLPSLRATRVNRCLCHPDMLAVNA